MTTLTPFISKRSNPPFQFEPILDGVAYLFSATWNVFGQRWYGTLATVNGNAVFTRPIIGSGDGLQVYSMTWDQNAQAMTIVTEPHGVSLGGFAQLMLRGVSPAALNGEYTMMGVSSTQLTFDYPTAPGSILVQGTIADDIDLLAGYEFVSTLVYRLSTNNFEVTP